VVRSDTGCTWLLHVVSNTLHPLLLERSLLLLAALLATACNDAAVEEAETASHEAAAEDGAGKQQQQQQQQQQEPPSNAVFQQLLQHWLVEALDTVLVPAAAPGAQLQEQLLLPQASTAAQANSGAAAAAAAGQGSGGGWSDDDSPSMHRQQQQHADSVCQQPGVLLALVGCLEQIGQQDAAADTLLQQMPALPQQLLQLMLSCHARDQFEVLVQLLPVLVLFRRGVLPLLMVGEGGGQGDTELCLQCWVCIAQTLCDCGQQEESLDAVDAAWYLLAAATRHALDVTQGAQQMMQQLCRCVCEGYVPDSSRNYASATLRQLLVAVADQPSLRSSAALLESRLMGLG
jgi:hypothetical protein